MKISKINLNAEFIKKRKADDPVPNKRVSWEETVDKHSLGSELVFLATRMSQNVLSESEFQELQPAFKFIFEIFTCFSVSDHLQITYSILNAGQADQNFKNFSQHSSLC